MTAPVFLAAVFPGAFVAALTALAFCGVKLRRAVSPAALLGALAAGVELLAGRFDMSIWIKALLLLCLGGVTLILTLRRDAVLCAAPGAVFFSALRLLDKGFFVWVMALDPDGLKIALGIAWLAILAAAFFAVGIAFSGKVWGEARSGQASPGGLLRLAVSLSAINLASLIALLPLNGLLAQLPTGVGGVLVGIECAFLCMAVLSCRLLLRLGQKESKLLENDQAQQELSRFMTIIRSQRHDYNLHLHTIAGLLRDGRYEESQQYIADVVADSQGVNVMMKIKEPIIGALISGYRDLAREQGCELDVCIADDLSSLVSTPYDTNRILGNLLQNALDEAAQHTVRDKKIRLETLRRGGNCVIRVSNAVADMGHLEHQFEYGFTSKDAHEGIGLSSVMRILELYKGTIYCEPDDHRIAFVVRIPSRI